MELEYYFGPKEELFTYEIDMDDIIEMANIYYADLYGASKGETKSLIRGLISNELLAYDCDDDFIEFLKEQFKDAAEEDYGEYCEYRKDPYAYYGVSADFF